MMISISPTPKRFFYQVMCRKKKAVSFFERYLPEKVRTKINLGTLVLSESKHLSDHGKSLYNDVLYRCAFLAGQPGYLFAMCEHQSTPDAQMPLRLLEYNIATIIKHLQQGKGKFPVIVNMVLYHGSKPWPYSTAFTDYYAQPVLGKEFLYMAPFTLITIPTLPIDVMIQDKELGFCFEAFRCTGQRDPYKAFRGTMKFSKQFSTNFYALPQEERNLVGTYLLHYMDRSQHSLEDLVNLLSGNPQEKEAIMTSIAQALKQEGIQKGRQEGIRVGRQEGETIGIQKGAHDKALHIARNMLSKLHLGINEVKQATGLSEEELIKLQEAGK